MKRRVSAVCASASSLFGSRGGWPPFGDAMVTSATLREVADCRRSGIVINTFMLARDRALVEFVKRMSAISRGKAYFTNTMTLGQFILMDFLKRKTRTVS